MIRPRRTTKDVIWASAVPTCPQRLRTTTRLILVTVGMKIAREVTTCSIMAGNILTARIILIIISADLLIVVKGINQKLEIRSKRRPQHLISQSNSLPRRPSLRLSLMRYSNCLKLSNRQILAAAARPDVPDRPQGPTQLRQWSVTSSNLVMRKKLRRMPRAWVWLFRCENGAKSRLCSLTTRDRH